MKLIKTVKLAFQEGGTDKVYEVDLCELESGSDDRFLVNFRYGRRGSSLRNSSKTPSPVDLSHAEDIFNSIVVSKTSKGYVELSSHRPPPSPSLASTAPAELSVYLDRINAEDDSQQRGRMIWRLALRPNAELASWLEHGLHNNNHWLENYARLWVIGHVGNANNIAGVSACLNTANPPLNDLAQEVLFKLGDEDDIAELKQANLNALPQPLAAAISDNDADLITVLLQQFIDSKNPDANSGLKRIYLASVDFTVLHQCLLEFIATLPLVPGVFKGVRYLFKIAEFRLDSQMFALLSYRFETTTEFFNYQWDGIYLPDDGFIKPSKELRSPKSRLAYSRRTRSYLRLRGWRTLRRLGVRGDERYVDMASQVLLQFSDETMPPAVQKTSYRWDYQSRRYLSQVREYDNDAELFIYNAILRTNNPQYQRSKIRPLWTTNDQKPGNIRGEAFAELWDKQPNALLYLMINSKAEAVSHFATRALKDNSAFCLTICDQSLLALLTSQFDSVIEFTLQLLTSRTISHDLFIALLKCNNNNARVFALSQLNMMSNLFSQTQLMVALLLIDSDLSRCWVDEKLRPAQRMHLSLDYAEKRAISDELMEQIAAPDMSISEHHAGWLASLLFACMSDIFQNLAFERLATLIASSDGGVQLLAARLLTINNIALRNIPEVTLEQIHQSELASVRAVGIVLLNKQSDRDLVNQLPFLVDLIYCAEQEERQACFELLNKLVSLYSREVFGQLLPLVFKEEKQQGLHQQLLDFITQRLEPQISSLDKDTVWRLLHARSVAAQTLGVHALPFRRPEDFSIKQWVLFASNPNVLVRHYAQNAFGQNVSLVKTNSRDGLRLLESRWQDCREFGFQFFKQNYQAQDWSPELIVSLCDSNLPDVQEYGRELLQMFFKQDQGEEYLLKLSQHPSTDVQNFVTHFLDDYAAGKPDIIISLKPYFLSVFSQVNKGRISKDRSLAFLVKEANTSADVLKMVSEIFTRLSLTLVHKDKAQLIKAMLSLQKQHLNLRLPIELLSPQVRSEVKGVQHAG